MVRNKMSLKSWQRAQAPVRICWWLKWEYQVRNSEYMQTVCAGEEGIHFSVISAGSEAILGEG